MFVLLYIIIHIIDNSIHFTSLSTVLYLKKTLGYSCAIEIVVLFRILSCWFKKNTFVKIAELLKLVKKERKSYNSQLTQQAKKIHSYSKC